MMLRLRGWTVHSGTAPLSALSSLLFPTTPPKRSAPPRSKHNTSGLKSDPGYCSLSADRAIISTETEHITYWWPTESS
ncbi:hypothetical protein SRHO_G00158860 [Serrasalmus rhombeus]